MRNLKRFLAVLVVVAVMATSMIPAFAAGAELSPIEVVTGLGIVEGAGNGVDDEYLAADTTKIQAAVILLKALGLYEEAINFDGGKNFADADEVTWAAGRRLLAYLKAHPELGWVGNPDGTFDAYAVIEPAQLYKVMLELLGYKQNVDFKWSEVLEKAVEFGMAGEYVDGEGVTNEDMIGIIYEALYTPVKGGTEEDVLLVYLAEINEAIKKKAIELGLIVVEEEPGELTATVAATGAKKLTVTFNQPVDTTKASFKVTKNNIVVNVASVEWNSDKSAATIILVSKMTAGDYTVTTSGLTETALSGKVTVTDEKVAKIEFTSPNAVLDAVYNYKVTTGYKVYNQYDEDVTTALPANARLSFTAGKGNVESFGNGQLTVSTGSAVSPFIIGEKLAVSALDQASTTFASSVLTVVDKAQVASISIDSLYNANGKTPTKSDGETYYLLITVKDQYGNDIPVGSINEGVSVVSTNPAVIDVSTPVFSTVNNSSALRINVRDAGTAQIIIVSKTHGTRASFDITVKDVTKVDLFTPSTPDLAVAGDDKVEIPFTAVDQYGNAVTDVSALSAITINGPTPKPVFTRDYVKNVTKMTVDLSDMRQAGVLSWTFVTPTGKVAFLTINAQEPAKPVVITGTKDFTRSIAQGNSTTLALGNIVVNDQYGRPMDTLPSGYTIKVTKEDNTNVQLTGDTVSNSSSVTLAGNTKGNTTITLKLYNNSTEVRGSDYTFTARTVDKSDFVSYELSTIDKVYANGNTTHARTVEVKGVMADGTKVVVPETGYYVVNLVDSDPATNYAGGKVYAESSVSVDSTTQEATATLVVTIKAAGSPVLTTPVTFSKVAPKITSLYLDSYGTNVVEDANAKVISANLTDVDTKAKIDNVIRQVVKAKDQYGVDMTGPVNFVGIYVNNISNDHTINGVDGATTTTLIQGDTFEVTAIAGNAAILTIKVIVK